MLSDPFLKYHPTCKDVALPAVRQYACLFRVWQSWRLSQIGVSVSNWHLPKIPLVSPSPSLRNGALRNGRIASAVNHKRTCILGLDVMQQEQVLSVKFPCICLTDFPRSKGRNLWRNPPWTKTAEHNWLVRDNAELDFSLRQADQTSTGRAKSKWSNPTAVQSGLRDSFTFHYACGMNEAREGSTSPVQTTCFTQNFALRFPDMDL